MGQAPTHFFFFFCVVFMFPNVSKKNKKLDKGVGGCSLINESFFFDFYNLTRSLSSTIVAFNPFY